MKQCKHYPLHGFVTKTTPKLSQNDDHDVTDMLQRQSIRNKMKKKKIYKTSPDVYRFPTGPSLIAKYPILLFRIMHFQLFFLIPPPGDSSVKSVKEKYVCVCVCMSKIVCNSLYVDYEVQPLLVGIECVSLWGRDRVRWAVAPSPPVGRSVGGSVRTVKGAVPPITRQSRRIASGSFCGGSVWGRPCLEGGGREGGLPTEEEERTSKTP